MDALLDLPKLDHLPVCEEDARYTKSFDCNRLESFDAEFLNEVYSFFDEYGFVVISNVYTPIECELTRAAMWEIIEFNNCGINRNDPKTWSSLKSKGQYGLSIRGPSFHPILVKNRLLFPISFRSTNNCLCFKFYKTKRIVCESVSEANRGN